ncbi:MAG: hypothetical protein H0Z37_12285, partial [Firmicutes bacterium]|nr:hypothetical protein [Bacillota bacterium]
MKKILLLFPTRHELITPEEKQRVKELFAEVEKEGWAKVDKSSVEGMYLFLSPNRKLAVFPGEYSLENYDLVYFVSLIGIEWLYRVLVKLYPKLPLFQTLAPGALKNKLYQYACFHSARLPFPRTLYLHLPNPMERWEIAERFFSYPMVIKSSVFCKGEQVFLVKNAEEAERIFNSYPHSQSKFLIQEFIPNNWDGRIIVAGNKVRYALKRVRQKGEWRNNVSLGAERIEWPLQKVPSRWKKLALKALKSSS